MRCPVRVPSPEPPPNVTLSFIKPQLIASASRLFQNQMFVCICMCVFMHVCVCNSLARVLEKRWVKAVSGITLFLS